MPLTQAFGETEQVGLCEFEANLVDMEFQVSQGYIVRPSLKKIYVFQHLSTTQLPLSKGSQNNYCHQNIFTIFSVCKKKVCSYDSLI